MRSADVAFSQADSQAGHAVEKCNNRVLMLREHEQVFSLNHERGMDPPVISEVVISSSAHGVHVLGHT